MILEKRAGWYQAILVAIQFRILHVLIYETDIVPVILCGREIWCLVSRIGEPLGKLERIMK